MKPRVRIESNGTTHGGTRVLIDGNDYTNLVTAVTWHLGVGEGPATATVTFLHVDIAAEAEFTYAPEDWERLRSFAPNLVDAIENTRPVEGRAKTVPAGGPFTPVAVRLPDGTTVPYDACDLTAEQETAIGRLLAADAKLTPEQWCAHYGVEIRDPDGWRHPDAPLWTEPITLPGFQARAAGSTRTINTDGWDRIARDVAAAKDAEPYVPVKLDPAAMAKLADGDGFEDLAAKHPLG